MSRKVSDPDVLCKTTATVVANSRLELEGVINSASYRPKISGGHAVIIFKVNFGATLILQHLEMQHGFSETQQGAAIRSEGVISVTDCVFAGHHAVDRVAAGAWHYVGNSGFQRGSAYVFASSDIRRRNTEVTWQAAIWSGAESKTDLTNNYFFYGCDEDVSPSDCANPGTRTVYNEDETKTVACCYRKVPHGLLIY